MKRILICSTNYLPHIGGAEIAVDEITKRLSHEEYVFDLITARLSRSLPWQERIGSVIVHRVGFGFAGDKFLLPCLGFFKFLFLRFQNRYDRVWSMMASQGSVLASFISILFRIPLTLTLQEGDEEKHLERYVLGSKFLYTYLIYPWHVLVFKCADRVTVISEYLKTRARKHTNAPIVLVPNGVDLEKFSLKKDDARVVDILQACGFEDKKVIVSVSRLVYKNNLEILIKALALLPTDFALLLVGEGNKRSSLERLAKELRVSERVCFTGSIETARVPAYLAAGDVCARISRSEGFGSMFLEAFAAGVPVVASPVGGIVDVVVHEETGLLVSTTDEKQIAHAILKLTTNENLRHHIITEAKQIARQYTWDRVAQKMGAVL